MSIRARLGMYAQDVARGIRAASRNRTLLASSALAMALGIASPATIFSIVRGLSRDLPFGDGDRIVYVTQSNETTGQRDLGLTPALAIALMRAQQSLSGFSAYVDRAVSVGGDDMPSERFLAAKMTASAFDVLGVRPIIGRTFTADEATNAGSVALISGALWRDRFAESRDVIGRVIRINGRPARIIGVMPADFRFPSKDDVWLPLAMHENDPTADTVVNAFGRLKPGISSQRADREFATLGARVVRDQGHPHQRIVTRVLPFKESQLEASDLMLFRAMVLVVSMVLLVACANVANLYLAQIAARGPQFAIKSAIGASRSTVVRELLTEVGLASLLGGFGGILLAWLSIRWFNASVADAIPAYWMRVSIDRGVVMFSIVLTLLATIAAGLTPALNAARANPAAALREQVGAFTNRGSRGAMRFLLVAEVAVSCALLVVAGIMAKGVVHGARTPLGVDASRLSTAHVYLGGLRDPQAQSKLVSELTSSLSGRRSLSGIGFTTVLPGRSGANIRFGLAGETYAANVALPTTRLVIVTPQYFDLLALRPVVGRLLDQRDNADHPRVAVVNEAFARRHFPSRALRTVIGTRVQLHADSDTSWTTIVGVIPDIGVVSIDPETIEQIVVPFAQHPTSDGLLLSGGAAAVPEIGRETIDLVRQLSSDVVIDHTESLSNAIARSRRASWSLASIFAQCGLAGLILAAVGVYGVAATASRRRVREVAIRQALGSSALGAGALVFRESAIPVAIGLAIGSAMAMLLSPGLDGLLFGESPHDPTAFLAVNLALASVMLIAGGRPAFLVARRPLGESLRNG